MDYAFTYNREKSSPLDEWLSKRARIVEHVVVNSPDEEVKEVFEKELDAIIKKELYMRKWFWIGKYD